MFCFLFLDQIFSGVGNFLASILSWIIIIAAIGIIILLCLAWKEPSLALIAIGELLKTSGKLLINTGKILWKARKITLPLIVSTTLFLLTMKILPYNSWNQNAQILTALIFSATATTTLIAAIKNKPKTALKLLILTAASTGTIFLTVLLPTIPATITGELSPTILYTIGGITLIATLAMVYTRYRNRLTKEDAEEKETIQEPAKNPPAHFEENTVCLRVVRIPENYLEYLKKHEESQLTALQDPNYAPLANTESYIYSGVPQFQRIIKTLGNTPIALETEFKKGKTTIRFHTKLEHIPKLKKLLESHIPGLELKTETTKPQPQGKRVGVVRLEDAVPNSPTPLSPIYDYFIRNGLSGTIYICVKPYGNLRKTISNTLMNYTYKQIKKKEKENGNAINYKDEQKMQRIRKTLEEGKTKIGVYAAVYINPNDYVNLSLETLAAVLASGFRPNNGYGSAKVSPQNPQVTKKFRGVQVGANLELTNPEAAAILQIQIPVETEGFTVDKTADFTVKSPGRGGEKVLWLGWLTRRGIPLEEKVYLNLEGGNQQILVAGSPGRGKSNFIQEFVWELWKKRVHVVIIEPVKKEYRRLGRLFPVHIFTVGNESVSPLRLNPMEVPEGVSLESHISSLVNIFQYSYEMKAPLPEVLRKALYECYTQAGWDATKNVRGRTPNLLDLVDAMRWVAKSSTYSAEVKMNIESAGITRVSDLTLGSLGAMMLASKSTPFSIYKECPTIIELDAVGEDEKTLVASLILHWIYSHMRGEGPSKSLKMVVVVEEAHRVAEDRVRGYSSEERRRGSLSNLLVSRLLREGRGYGLGVVLSDQNPMGLSEDVIKNTNTKVLFALPDASDRRRMGESIGLNEGQIEAMTNLKRGQAILWVQGHNPVQIEVRNIEEEMRGKCLSTDFPEDEEVREYMQDFFDGHLELRKIHPHVHSMPSEVYRSSTQGRRISPPEEGEGVKSREFVEVCALCERICAASEWKTAFSKQITEGEREKFIQHAAWKVVECSRFKDIELVIKAFKKVLDGQKPLPEDGDRRLEIQSYCEKICAHPRWKEAFKKLNTKEKREEYIIRAARNIAKRYQTPDIKQVIQILKGILNKQ